MMSWTNERNVITAAKACRQIQIPEILKRTFKEYHVFKNEMHVLEFKHDNEGEVRQQQIWEWHGQNLIELRKSGVILQ